MFRQKQRQSWASMPRHNRRSGEFGPATVGFIAVLNGALRPVLHSFLAPGLLLALSACGPAPAAKLPRETLLTLTGIGTVMVRPDEVVATGQVDTIGNDAAQVRRTNEGLAKKLTQRLNDRGVRSEQITLLGPELRADRQSVPRPIDASAASPASAGPVGAEALAGPGAQADGVTNYRAISRIRVQTPLRYAELAIEEISTIGALGDVTYRLHDDQSARNDARALAMSRARAAAQRIARSGNLSVRRIVTIEDLRFDAAGTQSPANRDQPFEVRAEIRIVFALK